MGQHGFDFDYLYKQYMPSLANDSIFLTTPYKNVSIRTLTYDGCVNASGTSAQYYSRQDVYDRVLLWRIPLIALWATTMLPALGWHTQVFTLMHLIADPIDTIWSLLYKLDLARRTAQWARDTDNNAELLTKFTFLRDADAPAGGVPAGGVPAGGAPADNASNETENSQTLVIRAQTASGNQDRRALDPNEKLVNRDPDILRYYQDVIALIITAYDEWDLGLQALQAIDYGFDSQHWGGPQRADLRERCASAAFYIASDRVSRFLPSVISTIVFLSQVAAGFWKTLNAVGAAYEDSNPVSKGLNRAPHNIAFGALFFWLPLAVLMTAFVGGSQTPHFVPHVLKRLRLDVHESCERQSITDQGLRPETVEFPDLHGIADQRWAYGGLPVWQPAKFRKVRSGRLQNDIQTKQRSRIWELIISLAIVAIPTGCAMAVSWLTPTQGFGCRAVTQLGFFGSWIINLWLDLRIFSRYSGDNGEDGTRKPMAFRRLKKVYWITFVKDFGFASGTIILLTFTALGIFNNCDCWCKWTVRSLISSKARYLSFPQEPYIFNQIKHQLRLTFPLIIGFALVTQVILFIIIAAYFREGWRVLKQRDIDTELEDPEFLDRPLDYCIRLFTRKRSLERSNTFDAINMHRLPVASPEVDTPLIGNSHRGVAEED